jgi:hypothetical protein
LGNVFVFNDYYTNICGVTQVRYPIWKCDGMKNEQKIGVLSKKIEYKDKIFKKLPQILGL